MHWTSGDTRHSAELPLECCVSQNGARIERVVIALHGYGDNARNFSSVAGELGLKDTLWINLQAPETLPFPGDGGQWYELFGQPHTQLRSSMDKVKTVLEIVQKELNIDWSRIFLFGFSQGAFVSLLSALEFPHQLGGVVALSGYLAQAHRITLPNSQRKQLPVFLAHGLHDQVVFPAQHFETLDILGHLGFSRITAKTYKGVAHSLCAEELFDIRTFIEGLP
jgi:predicted esterase